MIATPAVRLGVCSMMAVVCTSTAFAWGPQAHRVIARVAEGRLSPTAKAAIDELLIPPDTLPDVAGWADKEGHDAVPGIARWHFINVPIGDARFDPRLIRDDNNVVVKIKQYRKILSDRSRPKKERQRALLSSSISSPTSTSRCTSATTTTMAATTPRSGSSTRAPTSTSSGIPTWFTGSAATTGPGSPALNGTSRPRRSRSGPGISRRLGR